MCSNAIKNLVHFRVIMKNKEYDTQICSERIIKISLNSIIVVSLRIICASIIMHDKKWERFIL